MDALGSDIRIDTRGREVMRILPRDNDDVNEEWISDKTRHVVDGLRTQRLDQPYIRENGRLQPATWREGFPGINANIEGTSPVVDSPTIRYLLAGERVFPANDAIAPRGVQNNHTRPNASH